MDDPWAAWPPSTSAKAPAPPRMSLSPPPPDDDVDPWGPPVPKPSSAANLPSLDALAPKGKAASDDLPSFDAALPSWGGEWGATPKKPQPPTRRSPQTPPISLSPTLPKSPLQVPLPRTPSPDAVEQAVEAAWGGEDVTRTPSRAMSRPSLTLSRPGTTSPAPRTATPQFDDERNEEDEEEPPSPGQALERALDVISPKRTPSPTVKVEEETEIRGFPSPETAMRAALGELDPDEKLPDLDTLMPKPKPRTSLEAPRDGGLGLGGMDPAVSLGSMDLGRRSMSPSSDFGGFGSPARGDDPWGAGDSWGDAPRPKSRTPSPTRQEKQWEVAQSEMRLRDELAPFDKIQSLKKEWDGVAAAVIGDNAPVVTEDEERKLDADANALRDHSVDTLRSMTVVPDTSMPMQTKTGEKLSAALARPNPTPQSSLLYAPNIRRRPLGPGLESKWAQRSRLGEPELPAESRPSLDSNGSKGWSFWRKQAPPPKPLVTSGGGVLERKSEDPGRASGSRPASIASIPTPVTSSRPETPTVVSAAGSIRSGTPTIPEGSVAPTPTGSGSATPPVASSIGPATQQGGSRMSRLFRWGKKPSQAEEAMNAAGAKEDLELSTDDFAFLSEVPSHMTPGSGDLLGMDGPQANLEDVLNAPKAVPLPAPLAPPPSAPPKRNDSVGSGKFIARMASAPAPVPTATDLLSGLDFDAPPPPAGKPPAGGASSSSLWEDFLDPTPTKASSTSSEVPGLGAPPKSGSRSFPTLNAPPKSTSPGFPTLTPTPPSSSPVTANFPGMAPPMQASRSSTPKTSIDVKPSGLRNQSTDFGFGDLSLSPPKSTSPAPLDANALSRQKSPSARAYGPSGGLGGLPGMGGGLLPARARYGPSGPARSGSVSSMRSVGSETLDVASPPSAGPKKLQKGPTGYGKLNAVGSPSPPRKPVVEAPKPAPPPFAGFPQPPVRATPTPPLQPMAPTPTPPPIAPPIQPTSLFQPTQSHPAPMQPNTALMQPASARTKASPTTTSDDFGDFGDFGDFSAAPAAQPSSSPSAFGGFASPAANDDFGDFGDFTSFATPKVQSAAPTPPSKSSVPAQYRPHGTPSKAPRQQMPPAQMAPRQKISLTNSFNIPSLAPPPGSSRPAHQSNPPPSGGGDLLGGDLFDFASPPRPSGSSSGSGRGPNVGGMGSGMSGFPSASALASLSASAGSSSGGSPRKVDHMAAAELVEHAAKTKPAQWPSTSPIKALAPPPGDTGRSRPSSIIDLMDE